MGIGRVVLRVQSLVRPSAGKYSVQHSFLITGGRPTWSMVSNDEEVDVGCRPVSEAAGGVTLSPNVVSGSGFAS